MWKCELCVRGWEVQSVLGSVRSRLDIWALTTRSGAMRPNCHHIQHNGDLKTWCRKFINRLFTSIMFLCKAMQGYKILRILRKQWYVFNPLTPVVTDSHHTALHSDRSRDSTSLKLIIRLIIHTTDSWWAIQTQHKPVVLKVEARMQTLTCLESCWRLHTCFPAASLTLKHDSNVWMPSPLKLISYASYSFIPGSPEAQFQTWLSPWNLTPKSVKAWAHAIRAQSARLIVRSGLRAACSLLPLVCGIWQNVHSTKQPRDLTLGSFVWCLYSPTCPSFPSTKIGPALGGSCGFDHCVQDGAANALQTRFFFMGLTSHVVRRFTECKSVLKTFREH